MQPRWSCNAHYINTRFLTEGREAGLEGTDFEVARAAMCAGCWRVTPRQAQVRIQDRDQRQAELDRVARGWR